MIHRWCPWHLDRYPFQHMGFFFKTTLNQVGLLWWNIEELTTTTTCLDSTINIKNQSIQTNTFQKEDNLYLYIPPLSAHPTSCFKGLITGELLCFWNLNSSQEDFIDNTIKFISRLLQRGHYISDLIPTLQSAAVIIDNPLHQRQKLNNNSQADKTRFIHWQFHPNDISKAKIQQKTFKSCQNTIHQTYFKEYAAIL